MDSELLTYIILALSALGSFATLFLLLSGTLAAGIAALSMVFPALFAVSVVFSSANTRIAGAFEPLAQSFIQQNVHLGRLLAFFALVLWVTSPLWIPAWTGEAKDAMKFAGVLFPLAIGLTIAALYGLLVRWQVDDVDFSGFIEDSAPYKTGIARVALLLSAGLVLTIAAVLVGIAGMPYSSEVTQTYLYAGLFVWICAIFAMSFHIPVALAKLARAAAARTIMLENVFFLGELVRKGQIIVRDACAGVPESERENAAGADRGILKGIIARNLSGLQGSEVSTAKIPIPAKLNPRFGEKEVHKYIQVTMPVHAGMIKTFVSVRPIGPHLVVGWSMYFLGEHSPTATLANSQRILSLYMTSVMGGKSAAVSYADATADADGTYIAPRRRHVADMDLLLRAPRDEIVDEILSVIYMGIRQALSEFEELIEKRRVSERTSGGGGS